ncbi:MAG: DegV family protein [Actinomycetota bacterium]
MTRVAVITDSAANLPTDLAAKSGISVVPMYLKFGAEVLRDGVDLAGTQFYERLVSGRMLATTSAPSPGDFLRAFDACFERGADCALCVSVASSMSVSCDSARLGARNLPERRVEVLDSGTASIAEGFVALEAARAAAGGAGLDEVVSRAEEIAARVDLVAAIGTFEFLRRSGRVNSLAALAATALDIHPVFRFRRGHPGPIAKPRTRRRALERVMREILEGAGDRPVHLGVFHAGCMDDALAMEVALKERLDVRESLVTEFTAVMGAHTGPGLVGAAYWTE